MVVNINEKFSGKSHINYYMGRQCLLNKLDIIVHRPAQYQANVDLPDFNIKKDIVESGSVGNCSLYTYSLEDMTVVDIVLEEISEQIARSWPPKTNRDPDTRIYIKNMLRLNYYLVSNSDVVFVFDEITPEKENRSDIKYLPRGGNAWCAQIAKDLFKKDVYIFDIFKNVWYDYTYQEEIPFEDMMEDVLYNKHDTVSFLGGNNNHMEKATRLEIDKLIKEFGE